MRRWIVRAKPYLLGGAISVVGLLVAYACFGIYPFGKLSVVYGDMHSQYLDFHAMLWRVLREGESPAYSFLAGLGGTLIPMFAYYLMSPFSLLVAFFPIDGLQDALLLITLLKVAAIAMGYVYFARHALAQRGLDAVLFAPCYALSGYVVAYASNIMWLDGLILLPIVLVQLLRLLRDGRWLGLCLSLTVLFWVQFYIGYMVGIFVLLAFFLLAFVGRYPQVGKRFLQFAGATLLAAGLCAVLLLPTAIRLLDNALHTTVNQQELGAFSISAAQAMQLFSKNLFAASDGYASGQAQIYSGMACALLLPVYLLNSGIPLRRRLCTFGLAALLFVSCLEPHLTYFWHAMDRATGFPCRFSFLLVFLMIYMANDCYIHRGTCSILVLVGSAVAWALFVLLAKPYGLFPDTLRGREGIALALLLAYLLLFLWMRQRPGRQRWAAMLLLVCIVVEMSANAYGTLLGIAPSFLSRETLLSQYTQRQELLAQTESAEGMPYRVDDTLEDRSNISFLLGTMRQRHFNSAASGRLGDALNRLGYHYGGIVHHYLGSTIATESLFGLRYLAGDRFHMPGQKPNDYYAEVAQAGRLALFENAYAFPLAFAASEEALSFDILGEAWENVSQFTLQNSLFASLAGQAVLPLYVPIELTAEPYNLEAGEWEAERFQWWRAPDPDDTSYLRLSGVAELDAPVYVGAEILPPTGTVQVKANEYTLMELESFYRNQMAYAGQYWPGETVAVYLYPMFSRMLLDFMGVYALDMDVLSDLSDSFYDQQMTDVRWTDTRITGSVETEEDQILFLSVPYDGGWLVTVDGKPASVEKALGIFLGIRLSPGTHQVELTYRPVGLVSGAILSGISLLVLLTLLGCRAWLRRRGVNA